VVLESDDASRAGAMSGQPEGGAHLRDADFTVPPERSSGAP